jgi:CxxH/CxxC protein (TIGR04129 family)
MLKRDNCCCENHVDMAFDDFLIENETFPYLEKIQKHKCNYCDNDANIY